MAELLEEAAPALILVDEFVAYLVKARAIRVEDSNLAEQTLVFLQELATAVSQVPRVALVATLPQSSLEVAVTREEEAQRLLDRAMHILGRQNLIETPVAADEIFGVLRKRLFSQWGDERTAEKVARAFRKYYTDHAGYFPETVQEKRYEERIVQAYPFHPEFIDILQYRWGPHHRFQRTRGALRTLAFVIRDLWQRRPGSAYLIQPWAVDLSDRPLRGWIVELPGSEYENVITSDILDKGRELERDLKGDYYKESLVTSVATAVLLYSISASPRELGATEEQIRVAVLRPRLNPAMIAEVLSRMRDQFWYLVYRDRKYRFQTKPNLNKMLQDFEHSVEEEEIEEEMLSQLEAEERKEVEGRIRERQEELQQTIRRAYTRLFRPRPPEGVEEVHTRRRELVRAETIAEYAWEVLKGEGRLVEKLSPEYLLDKVWTERESGELSYQRLLEAFWQQPGLPLLASEEVLREAIAEGQRKELFGVIRRDKTTTEVKAISAEEVTTAVIGELSLVTREKAGQIVKEVPVEEVKKRTCLARSPGPALHR